MSGKPVAMLKVFPDNWEPGKRVILVDIPEWPVGSFDVDAFLAGLEADGWNVRRWYHADSGKLIGARAFLGDARSVRTKSEVMSLRDRIADEAARNGRLTGRALMSSGVDPSGLELFYDL
jgi:hypothetical protein